MRHMFFQECRDICAIAYLCGRVLAHDAVRVSLTQRGGRGGSGFLGRIFKNVAEYGDGHGSGEVDGRGL